MYCNIDFVQKWRGQSGEKKEATQTKVTAKMCPNTVRCHENRSSSPLIGAKT